MIASGHFFSCSLITSWSHELYITPVAAATVLHVEIFHVAVFHVAVLFLSVGVLAKSSILLPRQIVIWDSVFLSVGGTSVVFVQEWSTHTINIRDNILRREYIGI
jgi:hypothetical protein